MRLWHELLASPKGMARGGRVGAAALDALRPLRRSGLDRLGEGVFGLGKRSRSRGSTNRQEPHRQGQTGLEAPCCGPPKRRPTHGNAHCSQRPQLESLGGGCGCYRADSQAQRQTAQTSQLSYLQTDGDGGCQPEEEQLSRRQNLCGFVVPDQPVRDVALRSHANEQYCRRCQTSNQPVRPVGGGT